MELCDGNMEEFVSNKEIQPKTSLTDDQVYSRAYFKCKTLDLLHQVAEGIQHLHVNFGIIHRDVKPSNVLLCQTKQHGNDRTIAKVADFGLSKKLEPGKSYVETLSKSTRFYMAQECYENTWRKASDIFALGILYFYALTKGCHPFGDKSYEQEKNIHEKNPPTFSALRENFECRWESNPFEPIEIKRFRIKMDYSPRWITLLSCSLEYDNSPKNEVVCAKLAFGDKLSIPNYLL